jgi:hypothetical protein
MPFFGPVPERLSDEFVCLCCKDKVPVQVGMHVQECLQYAMEPMDKLLLDNQDIEDEDPEFVWRGNDISPTAETLGKFYPSIARWYIPQCPTHALHDKEQWLAFLQHFKVFAELRAVCKAMRNMGRWLQIAIDDFIELLPIWIMLPASMQVQRQANWYISLMVDLQHTAWNAPGWRDEIDSDHCRSWQRAAALQDLKAGSRALRLALRGDDLPRKRARI